MTRESRAGYGRRMSVRRAGEADVPAVRATRLGAVLGAPGAVASTYEDNLARPDEHWLSWLNPMATFLYRPDDEPDEGEVLGMVAAWIPPESPDRCDLMAMWVDPAARGTGVGDELLAAASNWARAEGASIV